MSAQLMPALDFPEIKKLSVSLRLLLSLYAIIPACLLIQFTDKYFLHGVLLEQLPSSPTQFLLFQILFGTPHIVASNILLATNTEYVNFFKAKILWMTLALALVFGLGSLFISYRVFYVAVACWTVYHVLKQQIGVARGVCRLTDRRFYVLLWLSVLAGIFIYVGIFLKNALDPEQAQVIKSIAAGFCAALLVTALICQRGISTSLGHWFLWANVLLVLSSFYFYASQYYFLAILIPRLVHDATAYIFYVAHDYNKHSTQPQNFLYRWAKGLKLPVFIVLPVFSLAVAFVLQAYGDTAINFITRTVFDVEFHKVITVGLIGYLSLMHYYMEGLTWKHGSPYRQFIAFSK